MAIIRIEMSPRSQENRDDIISRVTDVMVDHGSPRENTHVILYEVSYDVWAKGGLTYSQRVSKAKKEEAAAQEAELSGGTA